MKSISNTAISAFYFSMCLLLLIGCKQSVEKTMENADEPEKKSPSAGIAVNTSLVRQETFNKQILANGLVEAKNKADIRFKIAERVAHIYVKNGEFIPKGKPIATLENQLLYNQLKRAEIDFETAKSQVSDVVEGFHAGGNDYLKKPFSMEELIVRIHALLGRIGKSDIQKQLPIGKYMFDVNKQTLTLGHQTQTLTHRETILLHELLLQKNQLLERAYILNKIWGDDDFFAARSMDVFVSKLRKKLRADASVEIINLRGFGYKLVC